MCMYLTKGDVRNPCTFPGTCLYKAYGARAARCLNPRGVVVVHENGVCSKCGAVLHKGQKHSRSCPLYSGEVSFNGHNWTTKTGSKSDLPAILYLGLPFQIDWPITLVSPNDAPPRADDDRFVDMASLSDGIDRTGQKNRVDSEARLE